MYITLEDFYILFKYLEKFNFGNDSFNIKNIAEFLKLAIFSNVKSTKDIEGFKNALNNSLDDFNKQESVSIELNKQYANYCDPTKFDVLVEKFPVPEIMKEKYNVSFFPETTNYGLKAQSLLCVITDLYNSGLSGLEKTFDLVDCNLAIIRVQKAKLDQNQKESEIRTLAEMTRGK